MIKRLIKIFSWILISLAILIGSILLLHWKTSVVERAIENVLNRQLEGTAKISYDAMQGSLLNHLVLKNVRILVPEQVELQARHIELRYDFWPLLKPEFRISTILIDHLQVEVPYDSLGGSDTVETGTSADFDVEAFLAGQYHPSLPDTLFDLFPTVSARNVQLYAATVHLNQPNLLLSDLELQISRLDMDTQSIVLQVQKMAGRWPREDLQLDLLSFELQADRTHAALNNFQLRASESELQLSAFIDWQEEPQINLNLYQCNLNLSPLARWIPQARLNGSRLDGNLSVSGAGQRFAGQVEFAGSWNGHRLDSLQADMEYHRGKLKLKNLLLAADGALVTAQGEGQRLQDGFGRIEFRNVNLLALDTTLVPTDLNGTLDFKVLNSRLRRASGSGALHVYDSKIDSLPVQNLNFALQAHKGNFQIVSPSFVQLTDSVRFNMEGTMSRRGQLDLTMTTFDNQLGELLQLFHIDSVFARYDAQLHLGGNWRDPSLSGNLTMPRVRMPDVALDSVSLNIFVQNLLSGPSGDASFAIAEGNAFNIPLQRILLEGQVADEVVSLNQISLYSGLNSFRAALQIAYGRSPIEITIPRLQAAYEEYNLHNDGTLEFTVDSNEVNMAYFRLIGEAGSALEIGGFWDFDAADLQAYVELDHIRLAPFAPLWKNAFDLRGEVNGTLEIMNPLHDMEINAELRADSLVYNNRYAGNFDSDFMFAADQLNMQKFHYRKNNAILDASGNLIFKLSDASDQALSLLTNTAASLDVQWREIDLASFLPLVGVKEIITGTTSGSISVSGTTGHPRLQQQIFLDDFSYDKYRLDSLRLYSQYNDGYVLLDSLSGIINGTSFDTRGWLQYNLNLAAIDTLIMDKPFSLALRSRDDQISFIGHLNEQLEAVEGPYELQLQLGGTLERPALQNGAIQMEKGRLLLSRVRDPIEKVKLQAHAENNVLYLDEFSGYSAQEHDLLEKSWRFIRDLFSGFQYKNREGTLSVGGTIGTENLLRPQMDLNINMDEFYVDYFIENAAVVLSTDNLQIRGRDTLLLSGDIQIPKGTYEVDLSQMEKNLYLSQPVLRLEPPFIAANLGLQMPGNFVVTSSPLDLANNFKLVMLGDLQMIMEPQSDAVQLSGHLETVSGKYASWNQNFEVESASVDFENPKVINPDIKLLATKKIGNRLFTVIVSGNLDNQTREIQITENGQVLDMSYLDKISMLTLGADIQQVTTQTDSTFRRVGEQVATTSVLTAVERGAEKYSGLDKVEISSNQRLLDLEKMKLNNGLKDASISFGKYLTSDLYVEYRTQFGGDFPTPKLSWQAGNRLGLQYRISKLWSLDSYYEKTERGNNKIQLGIKWELTF